VFAAGCSLGKDVTGGPLTHLDDACGPYSDAAVYPPLVGTPPASGDYPQPVGSAYVPPEPTPTPPTPPAVTADAGVHRAGQRFIGRIVPPGLRPLRGTNLDNPGMVSVRSPDPKGDAIGRRRPARRGVDPDASARFARSRLLA